LVDGADYLFGNEYEEALIERKSGWGSAEMLARVGVRITTLGSAGARIEQQGQRPIAVPAVPDAQPVDPTGSGDAFRSGFLAAVAWGLALERAPQPGHGLAVHPLADPGPHDAPSPSRSGTSAPSNPAPAAPEEQAGHLGGLRRR